MEDVLGRLSNAPPKVLSFVEQMGPRMLERNGIKARHYAVDPETGNMTHTFASLSEVAVRNALEMAGMSASDVDLLIIGCPSYDQSTPPTSALLQERLGIETCAEMEIHSNCSGMGKAVQIAFDALTLGRYRTALVCYSQLSSVYLRSCYFNQAKMDKTNAALRWILADGAGAVLLRAGEEAGDRGRVIDTFVQSVGGRSAAGMTAGGAAADLVNKDCQIPELYDAGRHHLWQDLNAVNTRAAPLLLEGLSRFTAQMGIASSSVDHYVVSIPSLKLYEDHIPAYLERLGITREQIQFRCANVGYMGGAATLVHLDQMVRSGEIKPGQLVVVHAVESSKWMSAGFALRW
ncbi:MAG TPA: 3-oxoacyl-ACP synthase III family protein [Phycisphaerae bacterium]|nr:3-oxoacyl-ACP synthase III family protein [Phycisphaerae bacterium]